MGTEVKNEKLKRIQSLIYELSARVSENTAKAGLHRSKVEENHFHILANTTANGVALRDLATKGLESHLAICLHELNDIETQEEEKKIHAKFATLKLLIEHLKARIEINRGLIRINQSLVEINKQMIAVNSSAAGFTDEIVLAAASTDLHHDRVMQEVLDEEYSISHEMIDELNEICDGLVETVAENTAHIEKLNSESDRNRLAIAGNNKRIHQLIDMVLEVSEYS
ncbi:MAG: hypothetical protein CMQ84_04500 [Gammaproteobacteria bacterium]|nr:hypothetical protein [Gammaproteobacteria bacterium]OUX78223.1 MAG: hypothetical protein CBC19_05155 [Oceanospirillales bacterium TMED59]